MKKKILTVLGTRPEIIRLSCIINKFDKYFNHILVHTNQNFDKELKTIFFKELNLRKPNYDLEIRENTNVKFIAKALILIERIIKKEKPDAFFLLGDTNSSLTAIVAKKYKIPVFHYEAGNRCFDERVPEEINRRLIDHISDINLTYSDFAKQNLIKEGMCHERVIKVGSPLYEVFLENKSKIENTKILKKLKIKSKSYILISYHREENVDNKTNLLNFINIIQKIQKKLRKIIIISTHPRTRIRLKTINLEKNSQIKFLKPMSYFEYMKLQKDSYVTISDSGSISEESSILGFNAITMRNNFERQEIMENPSVLLSDCNEKNLLDAIEMSLKSKKNKIHHEYNVQNVSEKIPMIIISYIPYVRNNIWRMSSNENFNS